MMKSSLVLVLFLVSLVSPPSWSGYCPDVLDRNSASSQTPDLALPQEKHLRNVRATDFRGENAEAYFSADVRAIFQSSATGVSATDYTMNIDGSDVRMVSNGDGRTPARTISKASAFFILRASRIEAMPAEAGLLKGLCLGGLSELRPYSPRNRRFDLKQLTDGGGYDAKHYLALRQAVFTQSGAEIWTSTRWTRMQEREALTTELGYDGGPFWSYDGKQIVYVPIMPQTEKKEKQITSRC